VGLVFAFVLFEVWIISPLLK